MLYIFGEILLQKTKEDITVHIKANKSVFRLSPYFPWQLLIMTILQNLELSFVHSCLQSIPIGLSLYKAIICNGVIQIMLWKIVLLEENIFGLESSVVTWKFEPGIICC